MTDINSASPPQRPPHSMASLYNHRCVYCGGPAVSRDHVPPKAWFARDVGKRVRVPSCELCNNGQSKNDEEFRVLLGLLAGTKTPTQKLLWRKARKTLRHSPQLRDAILSSKSKDEKSGEPVVSFPRRRFDEAMTRVVRALHWHHYREMIDPSAPVKVWRLHAGPYENLRRSLEVDLRSDHIGHDQFSYLHGRPIEDPSLSLWLLAFYRNVFVGVITGRKIEDDEFDKLAA